MSGLCLYTCVTLVVNLSWNDACFSDRPLILGVPDPSIMVQSQQMFIHSLNYLMSHFWLICLRGQCQVCQWVYLRINFPHLLQRLLIEATDGDPDSSILCILWDWSGKVCRLKYKVHTFSNVVRHSASAGSIGDLFLKVQNLLHSRQLGYSVILTHSLVVS